MVGSSVDKKLQTIFSKPRQEPAKKLVGEESWAKYDASRETDRFEALSGNERAREGSYDVHVTHHPMAPPYRAQVELKGDLLNGEMKRQDSLFLGLPINTYGEPTFLTTAHTQFTPEGIFKREAVEGPNGTTARTIVVNYADPSQNYVEEYLIAR